MSKETDEAAHRLRRAIAYLDQSERKLVSCECGVDDRGFGQHSIECPAFGRVDCETLARDLELLDAEARDLAVVRQALGILGGAA